MTLPASLEHAGRRMLLKYHKFNSGSGRHPPNSLPALEEALSGEVAAVEFDVSRMADGYALLHDARLERETNGLGPLRKLDASGLKALRLRDSDEPPATLHEVVARLQQVARPLKVQVDLKEVAPLEREAAEGLLGALEPLRANASLRVVVGCLADWNLRLLRRLEPDLLLGFDPTFCLHAPSPGLELPLPTRVNAYGYMDDHPLGFRHLMATPDYLEDRLESLLGQVPGAVEFYLHKGFIRRSLADGFNPVAFVHKQLPGALVDIWTLNDGDAELKRDLELALGAGVDQITTDSAAQLATASQRG